MTEQQETTTRKLAELKAYLERKVAEDEEEITTLRSFLEIVDTLLAEKSYRRLEIPGSAYETPPRKVETRAIQAVQTMSGVQIAELYVEGSDVRIVPSQNMRFDVNAPPLRAFLLGKILEPLRAKDQDAVRSQGLSPDEVLSYRIENEGTVLRQLIVKNYGDERRLNEIRNAVRWAFRKMYEKTIGT